MLFNSWEFLIFFPVVTILYFVIPKKVKSIWLLIASYFFYMCWNPEYILLILFSTGATYGAGLLMDHLDKKPGIDEIKRKKQKKLVLAACLVANLGLLAFFKYFDFIVSSINVVTQNVAGVTTTNPFDFILPVGISFFTFQALGYIIDVYRHSINAERNFIRYALFVAFFPQLVAGPIERSGNLLRDIQDIPQKKMWDYKRITSGLIIMVWGMFLKLVITDRISALADTVFSNSQGMGAAPLWIGAIAFSIQIYCDFAGYSTIAIGAARVLGFKLMENFNTPYFARSIKEFWRRWHLSLSTWFKDYLYIPLGGSRCSRPRRYLNLMITFVASGVWHGAGWTYVIWGGVHGALQIIGDILAPVKAKLIRIFKIKTETLSFKLLQTLITVFMIVITMVLFRATSLSQAFSYIGGMFSPHGIKAGMESIMQFGKAQWIILLVSLVILFLVSLIKYNLHMNLDEFLEKQNLWFKWAVIFLLLFGIIIFGVYGPEYSAQAFIYFQF